MRPPTNKQRALRIGIDLDSTLNTLDEAWEAWIREHHDPGFTRDRWTGWELHKLTKAGRKVYEFLDIPGMFRSLGIRPGAREVVSDLVAAGHDIYIPTACRIRPGREHVLADKVGWLQQFLPELDPSCLIVIQHKDLLGGLDLLVDDSPENIALFPNASLAFDQPWNRFLDGFHRAEGWAGVRGHLEKIGALRPARPPEHPGMVP